MDGFPARSCGGGGPSESSGSAAKRFETADSRVERRVERVEIDDFSSCIVPTTSVSPSESREGGLTDAPGSECKTAALATASGARLSASPRVSWSTRSLPGSGGSHVLCFSPEAQGRLSAGWWGWSSAFANGNSGLAAASARRVKRVGRCMVVRRDFESPYSARIGEMRFWVRFNVGGSSLRRDISVYTRWSAARMG